MHLKISKNEAATLWMSSHFYFLFMKLDNLGIRDNGYRFFIVA